MKTRTTKTLAVAATLGLFAGASAYAESDIDLRGGIGYDSNAFDLNPVVGEQAGYFTELEATVEANGVSEKGWVKLADIGVSAQLFESGLSDADNGRFYVRARADAAEKYDEHGWEWSLRYQVREKTYVSQLTGLVATDDAGNEIGDRYDSGAGDFQAQWRLPGTAFGRLSLEATVAERNYLEDYEQFGLDRLDYTEYSIGPGYEIGGRDHRLRINLTLEERAYRDRRASDAAGDPVAGTDLEYRYYAVDVSSRHRLSRRSAFELTGGYEIREDNGVGYADRTEWYAGLEWSLRFADDSRLSLEGEYSSRIFDQQVVGDPTINDEIPEKVGFDARIHYDRPFPFLDIRGFSLVADVRWESFDNSRDVRYVYDRTVGYIGVRKEF
jgi:hypothetical protein